MNNSGCSCRKHTIKAIGFPSPLPPISYRLSAMTIAAYQEGGIERAIARRSAEDFAQLNLSYISSLINIDYQNCIPFTCRRCATCCLILNGAANALEDYLTTHTRDFRRLNTERQRRISFLACFQDY